MFTKYQLFPVDNKRKDRVCSPWVYAVPARIFFTNQVGLLVYNKQRRQQVRNNYYEAKFSYSEDTQGRKLHYFGTISYPAKQPAVLIDIDVVRPECVS